MIMKERKPAVKKTEKESRALKATGSPDDCIKSDETCDSVAGGGGANEDQEMRMLETGEINCEAVLGRQAGLNGERA